VALLDRSIVRVLPAVPRPIVRRISGRYIAGSGLPDAIRVVKDLNAQGSVDEQALALRDAMRVLFPEAVALVSAARQGLMRDA
jgi:hypothetical protein